MISILKALKSLIKLEQVYTHNVIFKLHYKATVIMLVGFVLLLSSKQFFGDPIICDVKKADKDVINTFCWIYGTFVMRNALYDKELPGLGLDSSDPKTVYRSYYQWVCLVFFIQAIMFYLPRYVWHIWESGRLRFLVGSINGLIPNPNWTMTTRDRLVEQLLDARIHNLYMARYVFCEFMNFLNVAFQIYFLDHFVIGNFLMYGITYASHSLVNPIESVFPKITKCLYYKYGLSGAVIYYDALCVLPLNVLNEKLFLVLWYWLFYLLVLSCGLLIYRWIFLTNPNFRVYLLMIQTRNIDLKMAHTIVNEISFGDFFLLRRIGQNLNPILFTKLVEGIYEFIIDRDEEIYLSATDEV